MLTEKYNLTTYFMLPLLKLNSDSFGVDNFVNSYVTRTMQVVVEIEDKNKVQWKYWEHQNYAIDFDLNDKTTIIFNLPAIFQKDFNNFVEGKYSKFDLITKDVIKKYSGLSYMKPVGEPYMMTDEDGKKSKVQNKTSHRYLLALDKDQNLRKNLEIELEVKLPVDAELLDQPKESEFITL